MPFQRTLAAPFIDKLNQLYSQTGSWWQCLVDDPQVFIGIRNNGLNAYAGGGSIARVNWNNRRVQLNVHTKYLVFADPGPGQTYCDLLAGNPPQALIVDSAATYASSLRRIKGAATMLAGGERKVECSIGTRLGCLFDMEAAFNTAADDPVNEEDPGLASGRMDMVVIDAEGTLGSVELKLFSNAELRPRGGETPAVCGQLIEYGNWLVRNQRAVLAAYQGQAECFAQLQGKFFEKRRTLQPRAIDITPRLLIVGFDGNSVDEVKVLRSRIVNAVKEKLSTFSPKHIQAVGGPANVQPRHLLCG